MRPRSPTPPPARYRPTRTKSSVGPWTVTSLLVLLMAPCGALVRLARFFDPVYLVGYGLLLSALTYAWYRHDKRRAVAGEDRTPESTLHLLELLGGWPGAFLAQRALRHKVVKTSYQVQFWLIVALHEYVAIDYTQNWRISRELLALLPAR